MACILSFCDRLESRPGDHSCELLPGHAQTCRCECDQCLEVSEAAAVQPTSQPAGVAE